MRLGLDKSVMANDNRRCIPPENVLTVLFSAFSKLTSSILWLMLFINCLPFIPARWPKKIRFSLADNDS